MGATSRWPCVWERSHASTHEEDCRNRPDACQRPTKQSFDSCSCVALEEVIDQHTDELFVHRIAGHQDAVVHRPHQQAVGFERWLWLGCGLVVGWSIADCAPCDFRPMPTD